MIIFKNICSWIIRIFERDKNLVKDSDKHSIKTHNKEKCVFIDEQPQQIKQIKNLFERKDK